jgi:hypothetical protein
LDNVDKVILTLPILGTLDVLSTLYVESLGYSLEAYEVGFFASFFVHSGLAFFYAIVYLLIISALAYFLWFIKNKELTPSHFLDKILFVLLIVVVYYVFVGLTVVSVGNFLLPGFVEGRVLRFPVILLTYLSTAVTLSLYLWQDIARWLKANGNKKESRGHSETF